MTAVLEIEGLTVRLPGRAARPVLDAVRLSVAQGEVVGLVGESGSGKSMTARAVIGLTPQYAETEGSISVAGNEVLGSGGAELRTLRTGTAAMVFQDARAGINPVRRIGDFLTEAMRQGGMSRRDADARAVALLDAVGMPDPPRHLRQYPYELSGGMLQRVMIASVLAVEPRLVLCDEPTTALDVTTQAEIIGLLTRLQRETGTGMLFITHDLELASTICHRIYVMYAGRIVEEVRADRMFTDAKHPYTVGLLDSTPDLTRRHERLVAIPGTPLPLSEAPTGCVFADRCALMQPDPCLQAQPDLVAHADDSGAVACYFAGRARSAARALAGESR